MIACSACGTQITPGNQSCSGCGAVLIAHAVAIKKPSRLGVILLMAGFMIVLGAIFKSSNTVPPAALQVSDPFAAEKNEAVISRYKRGGILNADDFQHFCGKADEIDISQANTLLEYKNKTIPDTQDQTTLTVSYVHQILADPSTNPHFSGHSHKVVFLMGSKEIQPAEAIHILKCE